MTLGRFMFDGMTVEVESMAPSTAPIGDVLYLRRIDVFPDVLLAVRGPMGLRTAPSVPVDVSTLETALNEFLDRVTALAAAP